MRWGPMAAGAAWGFVAGLLGLLLATWAERRYHPLPMFVRILVASTVPLLATILLIGLLSILERAGMWHR